MPVIWLSVFITASLVVAVALSIKSLCEKCYSTYMGAMLFWFIGLSLLTWIIWAIRDVNTYRETKSIIQIHQKVNDKGASVQYYYDDGGSECKVMDRVKGWIDTDKNVLCRVGTIPDYSLGIFFYGFHSYKVQKK